MGVRQRGRRGVLGPRRQVPQPEVAPVLPDGHAAPVRGEPGVPGVPAAPRDHLARPIELRGELVPDPVAVIVRRGFEGQARLYRIMKDLAGL